MSISVVVTSSPPHRLWGPISRSYSIPDESSVPVLNWLKWNEPSSSESLDRESLPRMSSIRTVLLLFAFRGEINPNHLNSSSVAAPHKIGTQPSFLTQALRAALGFILNAILVGHSMTALSIEPLMWKRHSWPQMPDHSRTKSQSMSSCSRHSSTCLFDSAYTPTLSSGSCRSFEAGLEVPVA